jgi:glycosyltransferase involved in cell wall biosynthesis
MPPKLSIVTPSLNQGAFIERTIRSVLDQGYPNLEYVIVDGGSSDETVEIIRRYEDRLAWWVSEPDEGQTDAINKGIERTSGEIVAYINSDDYYLPGAFERAVEAFGRTDRKWVAGASLDAFEGTGPSRIFRPVAPLDQRGPLQGRQRWILGPLPWHVPQPSAFWRRELFERHGLFRRDMHYAFDAEFMVRLAFAGEFPLVLDDEVLAARALHEDAKSSSMRLWRPETKRIREIYEPQLTPDEARRLRILRPPNAVRSFLKLGVLDPVLRAGGRLLDHVPEPIRPPIRHRDRKPDFKAAKEAEAAGLRAPPRR